MNQTKDMEHGAGRKTSGFLVAILGGVAAMLASGLPATATNVTGAGTGFMVTGTTDRTVNEFDGADPDSLPDYICATLAKQTISSKTAYTATYTVDGATYAATGNLPVVYNLTIPTAHENPSGTYATNTCTTGGPGFVVTGLAGTLRSVPAGYLECDYSSSPSAPSTYSRIGLNILLELRGSCRVDANGGGNSWTSLRPTVEKHVGMGYFGDPHQDQAGTTHCVMNAFDVSACDYNSLPLPTDNVHWVDSFSYVHA